MLVRSSVSLTIGASVFLMAMLENAYANQDCQYVMDNLMSANSRCEAGSSGDCNVVPSLMDMATAACGNQAMALAGGGNLQGNGGLLNSGKPSDQIEREELAQKAREWEGQPCKYFTKPEVTHDEEMDVRSVSLNFYAAGAKVCHEEMMFVCTSRGTAKVWEYRGPCIDFSGSHSRSESE